MDVMENGAQGQVADTPSEPAGIQPQEAANPAIEAEEKQERTEEKPDIYIDNNGNLEISDEMLSFEMETDENALSVPESDKQTEEPEAPQDKHYKVKVGEEEIEVTLDELLDGYSRTKDYTQKTQKIADEKKLLESQKVELSEQMRMLEVQQRYGVAIPSEVQKRISAQAENALRQEYGDSIDEFSAEYQDARSVLVNQITANYSEQVKASQRIEHTTQYLKQHEPNFDKIDKIAMQMAHDEMTYAEFSRIQNAKSVGDPVPLLEVFDKARKRFYENQNSLTEQHQKSGQETIKQTISGEDTKTVPKPPSTVSGARGATGRQQPQPTFDANGFASMSAAQQAKALVDMGLLD